MATLHESRPWAMLVQAWRAYERPHVDDDLLVYIQCAVTMQHLRDRFPDLPRLRVVSFNTMINFMLDTPGLIGICVFSGGQFQRALRRVNVNLADRFAGAAVIPAPPPPPPSPVREYIDLSIEPETPALMSRSPPLSPA